MFTETSQLRNKPIFKPNALLKFISILSCFAICIEHGYDAEKTQIEMVIHFIIPDIVIV